METTSNHSLCDSSNSDNHIQVSCFSSCYTCHNLSHIAYHIFHDCLIFVVLRLSENVEERVKVVLGYKF